MAVAFVVTTDSNIWVALAIWAGLSVANLFCFASLRKEGVLLAAPSLIHLRSLLMGGASLSFHCDTVVGAEKVSIWSSFSARASEEAG